MKKLTVLSIVAATLLLVGCNESSTGAEAKAAGASATEKSEAPAKKCGEGKCGANKKSAATEAKEAATTAVEKTKEAVVEKAAEVKDAVAEKAAAATAAVAATATAAVDKTKEAASAVAEKAKDAVAGGADGKALFAKCAGCHGADGKTKALGKSGIIAGQAAADLETKIHGYKAGTLNTAGMGALMKGQVGSYSDEDIKAVATYISGL